MMGIGASQIDLLARLSSAAGVSGDESAVREIVLAELGSSPLKCRVDALGNLLVTQERKPDKDAPRVLVAAHLDEVGFMLTHHQGDGLFRFARVGGVDKKSILGKRVIVGREKIPGIIGFQPVHLAADDEKTEMIPLEKLRIDVGAEAAARVKVGDRAVFGTEFKQQGDILLGKAFDDRMGTATLVGLVKDPPLGIELLAAFTVQEEIGLRGAGVAAQNLDPDLAVALDCTPARDFPSFDEQTENTRYNTRLGRGPAIYVADGGTISDPRLVGQLIAAAERENLPYQIRQPGGGRTDAAAIHQQLGGIPSVSLSVPARYLHNPVSLALLSDWEAAVKLIHSGLANLRLEDIKTDR